MTTRTAPAAVHRPSQKVLSTRDRKALGKEYEYYARKRLPGEAPPRTIAHQPWEPINDLAWPVRRDGADAAMSVQSRGDAT